MAFQLDNLPNIILTVVIVAGVLFVGISTMSAMPTSGDDATGTQAVLLDGTDFVSVGVDSIRSKTVYNSLGYAVNLSGQQNSYWTSTQPIEYSNDSTWTLAGWAADDDPETNDAMTFLSVNGRVVVTYNESAGEWATWYYDESSRNSYEITAAASGGEANLTHVVVERNQSTLTMYVNGTQGGSVDLSTNQSTAAPNASNWHGRNEEVRTFDDVLNASERTQLRQSPVAPLPGADRTARIMFDEPSRNNQLLLFAPGKISTSNVAYGAGHAGEEMEGASLTNQLSGTTDYEWDWERLEIRAVNGGQLEDAPVAYVDYQQRTVQGLLEAGFREFIGLIGTLFIVIPLAFAIFLLRKL